MISLIIEWSNFIYFILKFSACFNVHYSRDADFQTKKQILTLRYLLHCPDFVNVTAIFRILLYGHTSVDEMTNTLILNASIGHMLCNKRFQCLLTQLSIIQLHVTPLFSDAIFRSFILKLFSQHLIQPAIFLIPGVLGYPLDRYNLAHALLKNIDLTTLMAVLTSWRRKYLTEIREM